MPEYDIYMKRRENLRRLLAEKELPGLLVSLAANRYYLSGFELHDAQCNESSGWLAITVDNGDFLFTDPRYTEEALRHWDEKRLCVYSNKKFETVGTFLLQHGVKELAFESTAMHLYDHDKLAEHVALTPVKDVVEELRIIKDEDEIRRMEAACALNHRLMEFIPSQLIPGRTEADVAWEVEKFYRENGAEGLSFSTIVGVGPNAALPHANPGQTTVRENELVLIDCGCRLDGYCSDQTRTFWVGDTPSDRFRTTLELVQRSQQAALDILRPGLTFKEAYLASRKVFEKAGCAEYFTHGLGHGIGLETHEPPRLSNIAEGHLKPGMIVTVEPGLYYADWGGIRWEYEALITEDGCRIL